MPGKVRKEIIFYLNGKRQAVSDEKAGWMLADYLRYERQLTGTKVVCAEGDCGACTVLRYTPASGGKSESPFLPVNACILLVAQLDGSSLVTVDALSERAKLTPVQRAMQECHGSQCGFCTPGFVMALTGLVEKKLCSKKSGPITQQEAKNCTTGNLCRCTGYEPILDAAKSVSIKDCESVKDRFFSRDQAKDLARIRATGVLLESETFSFFAPRSLKEAVRALKKNAALRIVGAGTDLGVVHNKRKLRLGEVLSLHLIPELYDTKITPGRVRVGARVTLTEVRQKVGDVAPEFARFLDLFASPQIKNAATLVGNVCNASPIADTPPFLLTADAVLHLVGPRGRRKLPLNEFYLAYRKTALKAGEFVTAIEFDTEASSKKKPESWALYKVSQRKDLDISTVNAAFRMIWADEGRTRIKEARLAMGGMAATPLRLTRTEKKLKGKNLDTAVLAEVIQSFHAEMDPIADLRGSAAFRRVASENLLRKFFRELEP